MQGFYDDFVEKAAESRHTTPEKIDAVAQGRVWTGAQAREHGLVDELGGLDAAVAHRQGAREDSADEDVELVRLPGRRTLYEALTEQFGRASRERCWGAAGGRSDAARAAALTAPSRLFRRGEPLALMPFAFVR